ncbi:lysylphosphatidylglycerol synthase transmembrane domain-containing protein [Thermogemmatispora sp.]|uniref:lysylphosphatidylglycerol synthase transmembrane domain-containing protein n=1 Tax=Thermogemmatispora sp. TaxID=1968838 RepID=UPI0035E44D5C
MVSAACRPTEVTGAAGHTTGPALPGSHPGVGEPVTEERGPAERETGGKPLWRLAAAVIALVAAALLVGRVLVALPGWQDLERGHVSYACLLLGGSGGLLCVVISAYQWRALLLAQGRHVDLAELIRLYLVGLAFSHCLPLGLGGDAIKTLYSGRALGSYRLAAGTLALARLLSLLALGLLLGGALCLWGQLLPAPLGAVTATVSLLIVLALTSLLGVVRLIRREERSTCLAEGESRVSPLVFGRMLGAMGAALATVAARPLSFLPSLGFSLCFWMMAALNYYSYGLALDIHLPLPCYVVAIPLVALAASFPLAFCNGLGIREGALVSILALYHVPAGKALLLALCIDGQGVLLALGGWLLYVLQRREGR